MKTWKERELRAGGGGEEKRPAGGAYPTGVQAEQSDSSFLWAICRLSVACVKI